jgi:trehalose 6-phosphate synthase/phosphatase
VVDADYCNSGLRDATVAAARDGKMPNKIWVGILGLPTDGLKQKQDIEGLLATEYDALTVFCPGNDLEGHYWRFCKQILWPVISLSNA